MDAEEHKRRIASILEAAPWEKSKTAQQKAERERKAAAAKIRREKREAKGIKLEWEEQRDFCRWLSSRGFDYFAVPNEAAGGEIDFRRMSYAKSIGLRPGVCDLVLVDLAPDGRPVVVEMKRSDFKEHTFFKNPKLKNQRKWRGIFTQKGWHHIIGCGCEDTKRKIQTLFGIT